LQSSPAAEGPFDNEAGGSILAYDTSLVFTHGLGTTNRFFRAAGSLVP
jgi:hypothetical protein